MRILADGHITDATISATNTLSFQNEEKLKIFQLSERFETSTNNTVITLDFGASAPDVNGVGLCGTNFSENATITLSYSDSSPTSPENTLTLTDFSNFNQVFFLDSLLSRRYWVISITDPTPNNENGSNRLSIGYIKIGEYTQVPYVEFPHTPALNFQSESSLSYTRQEFGSKGYVYYQASFRCIGLTYDQVDKLFDMIEERQNIEPVLLVEFEDSYTNKRYRPKYVNFTGVSYPYAMEGNAGYYNLDFTVEERF